MASTIPNSCTIQYSTTESALLARANLPNIYQQLTFGSIPLPEDHKVFPTRTNLIPPMEPRQILLPEIEPVIDQLSPRLLESTFEPGMMAPRPMPQPSSYTSYSLPSQDPGTYTEIKTVLIGYQTYYQAANPALLQQIFIEYYTPEGMPYYYNALTKATQWERPPPTCYIIPGPNQKIESRPAYTPQVNTYVPKERPVRPPHGGVRQITSH